VKRVCFAYTDASFNFPRAFEKSFEPSLTVGLVSEIATRD